MPALMMEASVDERFAFLVARLQYITLCVRVI